ncbi:MAG: hypothetical protein ACRDWW_09055, partial [Acidimicrobiales bacterium]
ALAIVMAIWARRGVWGIFASRVRVQLFPVGYWLRTAPGEAERRGPLRYVLGPVTKARVADAEPRV